MNKCGVNNWLSKHRQDVGHVVEEWIQRKYEKEVMVAMLKFPPSEDDFDFSYKLRVRIEGYSNDINFDQDIESPQDLCKFLINELKTKHSSLFI